ncbi:glycosyltransferase [Enemella sp. A6]|uniref:glycosyltransferase n=1 Tax=Enemella sp. A6 TaxID=3440152 RepID=UPI003EBFFC1F
MTANDVLVVIPAHNEEHAIRRCVSRVLAAVGQGRRAGLVDRATVVVVPHRCSDRTAELAALALAGQPVTGIVVPDTRSTTVAQVRRRGVEAGWTDAQAGTAERTWLFNTDADSWVPSDWITATLTTMRTDNAVAAAGLVDVVGWRASRAARRAYRALIQEGLHAGGHDHVYGANLVVRLDAYLAVGGFPHCEHGEDHALVARLRAAGYRVATPRTPRVATSGRTAGRCPDGLGALLGRLASHT